MYRTCLGHTEGELKPVYLLITDQALYILSVGQGRNTYDKDDVIAFKELDYISVSEPVRPSAACCTKFLVIFNLISLSGDRFRFLLTLRTSEAGIPTLRKLPYGVRSRYTDGTEVNARRP